MTSSSALPGTFHHIAYHIVPIILAQIRPSSENPVLTTYRHELLSTTVLCRTPFPCADDGWPLLLHTNAERLVLRIKLFLDFLFHSLVISHRVGFNRLVNRAEHLVDLGLGELVTPRHGSGLLLFSGNLFHNQLLNDHVSLGILIERLSVISGGFLAVQLGYQRFCLLANHHVLALGRP